MGLKAGAVFQRARALLDEYTNQGEFTDAILVPHLNMAIDAMEAKVFANPNIARMKAIVIVPNIAAGTTDLKDQFAKDGPLELMNTLLSMRERQAGQDEAAFLPMKKVYDLPSVTQTGYNGQYLWTGSTIIVPGATQPLDFRVYGEFHFQDVANADSPLIPNTGLILSHGCAASAGGSRGKASTDRLDKLFNWFMSQWMNIMIMEMQESPVRLQAFGTGLSINWW